MSRYKQNIVNYSVILEWKRNRKLVTNLQGFGIIPQNGTIKCTVEYCDGFFILEEDTSCCDEGLRWRCPGSISIPKAQSWIKCTKTASIHSNTFFENVQLPLWKVVAFSDFWAEENITSLVSRKLNIPWLKMEDLVAFYEEVVFDALVQNSTKIGGPGKIIEIDETCFGNRNYGTVNSKSKGNWVYGGYEKGSGKVFLCAVEQRSTNSLLDSIERFVEPGTIISSNIWRCYTGLKTEPKYQSLQEKQSLIFKTLKHSGIIKLSRRLVKAWSSESTEDLTAQENEIEKSFRRAGFEGGLLAQLLFVKMASLSKQSRVVTFFNLVSQSSNRCNFS